MVVIPLHHRNGHLFLELAEKLWLFDTGAPTSFGPPVNLAGKHFSLPSSYLGLTAESLSRFVNVECIGLLGADVLSRFDFVLDAPRGTVLVSTSMLEYSGRTVQLEEFMGIPIVSARIGGNDYRLFLDSGAQISYLQQDFLASFPADGIFTNFYPGVGRFQTQTYNVEITLSGVRFILRCGMLPGILGATLMMAKVEGILGNQVFIGRSIGYFPRCRILVS